MRTLKITLTLAALWLMASCTPAAATANAPNPAAEPTPGPTATTLPTPAGTAAAAPPDPTPTAGIPPSATPAENTTAVLPDFPLQAPIEPPGRRTVDNSYRFGSTQEGLREPHHGVEFLNSQGTLVHAAADGTVLFAGDDYNGGPYSPKNWYAFYGLFVLIEHDLAGYPLPVYTLYAHLSEISVQTGQTVSAGDPIGAVGFTGAAIGSHLHFEVRYGGTTYEHASNPELWLQPEEGHGALIGSIRDANGLSLPMIGFTLTSLADPGYILYFNTYEETPLAYRPPFFENFAIGNIPAGDYELAYIAGSFETLAITIPDGGRVTLELVVGGGE